MSAEQTPPERLTIYYQHGRVGHGLGVHAITDFGPTCGAGKNTIGTRRTSRSRITDEPITCKRCLSELGKRPNLKPRPPEGDKE